MLAIVAYLKEWLVASKGHGLQVDLSNALPSTFLLRSWKLDSEKFHSLIFFFPHSSLALALLLDYFQTQSARFKTLN